MKKEDIQRKREDKAQLMYDQILKEIIHKRELKFEFRKDFAAELGVDPARALRIESGFLKIGIERFFVMCDILDLNPIDLIRSAWIQSYRRKHIPTYRDDDGLQQGIFNDAKEESTVIRETSDGHIEIGNDSKSPITLNKKNASEIIPMLERYMKYGRLK